MQGPRFERKRAEMRWTWRVNSIIAENKPHAHHKTHLHTTKVSNTRPVCLPIEVLLIEILLYSDDRSIYFFQSNQCFRVTELVDWPILEKLDILSINLSKAFFHKNASLSEKLLYAVSHVACNAAGYQSHCNAYPQFPWSPLGMPGTMTPY